MRNILLGLIILAIGTGVYFVSNREQSTGSTSSPTSTTSCPTGELVERTLTDGTIVSGMLITLTTTGFKPNCVAVAPGTAIIWLNQSSRLIEIGADPHPLHTGNREVSGGEFVLELAPGESAAVTIAEPGTTGYHNHLNSTLNGQIIVSP